jgi:hypothetical protein
MELEVSCHILNSLHTGAQLTKRYPPSHGPSLHGEVEDAFEIPAFLILHNHVVQADASHHNVTNSLQAPCPDRISYNFPPCLQNTKYALHVLAKGALHLHEVFTLLSLWRMDGLHEAAPLWVYVVRKKVIAIVNVAVYGELHVATFAP